MNVLRKRNNISKCSVAENPQMCLGISRVSADRCRDIQEVDLQRRVKSDWDWGAMLSCGQWGGTEAYLKQANATCTQLWCGNTNLEAGWGRNWSLKGSHSL